METAQSIAKLGFRRWYERQLLEAHAWLVTCLLVSIGIAAALEGISFGKPFVEVAPVIGFLFVAGLICWHALKRYGELMGRANRLAGESTCKACGAYGIFSVTQEYSEKMKVRCRKCDHQWMLG